MILPYFSFDFHGEGQIPVFFTRKKGHIITLNDTTQDTVTHVVYPQLHSRGRGDILKWSMSNRKKIILLALSVGVAAVLSFLSCLNRITTPDDQVGDCTSSIVWDGLDRTYLIHIPPSYDRTKPMALVIALHGGGGTGEGMVKLTLSGFNTLADKEGFIVVYPDGTRHSGRIKTRWNDSRDERYSQADDVGYISALIEHLAQTLNIDRSRVYATGISNGAHMSMRLARELSDKIAAVAPVAYTMPERFASLPVSAKPISVLVMTGTKDPFVPWEGGETPDPTGTRMLGRVLSVPETVRVLVAHNQCSTTVMAAWEPDKDLQDGTRVRREVYGQCRGGAEVILYAIESGGHSWPGGWQYLPKGIIGKTSKDIDANEVIWNFFKHVTK